jgi:hypothetical protein
MSKRAKSGESTLVHPSRRSPRRSLSDGRAPLPPPLPPAPGQESHVEVEACETVERFGDAQYTAKDALASIHTLPQSVAAEPPSPLPTAAPSQSLPTDVGSSALIIQALRARIVELETDSSGARCAVCHAAFVRPVVSVICWHVCCEQCFLAALGTRGLCPHCTSITMPGDLRRIYF